MGELGSASEASILRVKHLQRRFDDGVNDSRGKLSAFSGERFCVRDGAFDHLCLLHHVVVLILIGVGDGAQDALEAGAPVLIVGREVGSTVERLAVGGEKSGQGPSALSAN